MSEMTEFREKLGSQDGKTVLAAVGALLESAEPEDMDLILERLDSAPWKLRTAILGKLNQSLNIEELSGFLKEIGDGDPDKIFADAETAGRFFSVLALLYLRFNLHEKAVKYSDIVLKRVGKGPSRAGAAARHYKGVALARSHNFIDAEKSLKEALGDAENLKDAPRQAQVLDSLGTMKLQQLALKDAEFYFNQSLALKRKLEDVTGMAITYGNLGRLNQLKGDYPLALDYFFKDFELAGKAGDSHGMSVMAGTIAQVYMKREELSRAMEWLSRAAEIAKKNQHVLDLAYARKNMAQLLIAMDRTDEALKLLDNVEKVMHARKIAQQLGEVEIIRGLALKKTGDFAGSESAFMKAGKIFPSINDKTGELKLLYEMAGLYILQGRNEKAQECFAAGHEIAVKHDLASFDREMDDLEQYHLMGERLVQMGMLKPQELQDAFDRRFLSERSLLGTLLDMGILKPGEYESLLNSVFKIPPATLTEQIDRSLVERFPKKTALEMQALPMAVRGNKMCVAMADPTNKARVRQMELILQTPVKPYYIHSRTLTRWINEQYSAISPQIDVWKKSPEILAATLNHAIDLGASDLHVESMRGQTRLRMRIDGILHDMAYVEAETGNRIMSQIKAGSEMDIAEKRRPQDGRMSYKHPKGEFNMRISSIPTVHGEKLVVRILYANTSFNLDQIGLDRETMEGIKTALDCNQGLFLVTGPTGSGKSTTLYAALSQMDCVKRNIITVEDPVEYQIPMITQSQAHSEIGFTFASALRSFLRQDPDVIFVGEIRDEETAEIAVRASLTGKLILSTLHTNDAVQTLIRLTDLGIAPHLVSEVMRAVLAQRLVRKLCPHCRRQVEPNQTILSRFEEHMDEKIRAERYTFYEPRGCDACKHIGFAGRTAIYEFLPMDDALRKWTRAQGAFKEIQPYLRKTGFRNFLKTGFAKAAVGITSLEEVLSVV